MGVDSKVPLSLCQESGEEIEDWVTRGNVQGLGNHSGGSG
jgi:hypothetical protein